MEVSSYFNKLNTTLKNYKRSIPFLLVDLDILDKNIETLKNTIDNKKKFRIVVKSLPSVGLVEYISQKINTKRLMVFHQPFLSHISSYADENIDILLGKPMPVKTANYYYKTLTEAAKFKPDKQLHWLADTKKRIEEYLDLAKSIQQKINLNLEIDVGLHRGGFETIDDLRLALQFVEVNKKYINFTGFMGYDAHIPRLPKPLISQQKAFSNSTSFYNECVALLQNEFKNLWHENLIFNGAGSPTVNLHFENDTPSNEIAAGSCLFKPTDFDIGPLKNYQPACFIATPILKQLEGTNIPGVEKMKGVLNAIQPIYKKAYFIYGGYWKADYCYPTGLKNNPIYGQSTNQSILNAPTKANLKVDDFVFLRPQQSEFVFLQFGNILAIRNGEIAEEWELLRNY